MADGIKKINEWVLKDGRVMGITKEITPIKFDGGTLYIHPNQGILKYNNISNNGTKSWKKFMPINVFDEKTIVRSLLQDSVVNSSKLEDGCVTTPKYAIDSITSDKLRASSVITEKIDNFAVTNMKISDLAVDANKIASNSIITTKIKDQAVSAEKIALKCVNNNHIADGTIKQEKLFNKTISNEKIANETIVSDLLANNSVIESKIASSNIKSRHIAINQIIESHILNRNITSDKIAERAIKNEHVVINSINGDKLFEGSVKTSKIADLNITNQKIADSAIDRNKLDNTLKTLIDDAIRVDGATATATVKGSLKVNGNITATGNITGAKVFNPVFADVAEAYVPIMKNLLEVGTPVCLCPCGDLKVEPLNEYNASMFLGFISDNYAACYGATEEEIISGDKVAVCLTGRIPIKIKINKSDIGKYLYIDGNGKIRICESKAITTIGRILDKIDLCTALVQI